MSIECIPAIDLREGRVVRLRQGDFARETRYEADPVALATGWERRGARWLHVVDLDAARQGGFRHGAVLARLREATGLRLQVGGGVRSADDVASLLAAGVERVVVGTVAVREPAQVLAWLDRFGPERICVALDARRDARGEWQLPVAGWTESGGRALHPLLAEYAGAGLRHLLCTDIARDGMLAGPNVALYADIAQAWPALGLIASGGVTGVADVVALRAAGARSLVLGRALLEGRLDLAEAIAC